MHRGIRFPQEDEVDEREQSCQSEEDDAQTVKNELHLGDLQELGYECRKDRGQLRRLRRRFRKARLDRQLTAVCLRTHRDCNGRQNSQIGVLLLDSTRQSAQHDSCATIETAAAPPCGVTRSAENHGNDPRRDGGPRRSG